MFLNWMTRILPSGLQGPRDRKNSEIMLFSFDIFIGSVMGTSERKVSIKGRVNEGRYQTKMAVNGNH